MKRYSKDMSRLLYCLNIHVASNFFKNLYQNTVLIKTTDQMSPLNDPEISERG